MATEHDEPGPDVDQDEAVGLRALFDEKCDARALLSRALSVSEAMRALLEEYARLTRHIPAELRTDWVLVGQKIVDTDELLDALETHLLRESELFEQTLHTIEREMMASRRGK